MTCDNAWKEKLFLYCSIREIDEPIVIATNNDITTNFNASTITTKNTRDVKLLIHGWNADAKHISMQPVRNAYLRINEYHVVAVDWREIANMPYIVARDLIGVIGRRICEIFKSLVLRLNVSPNRIHIIGHSLGEFLTCEKWIKNDEFIRSSYWNSCGSMF